MGTLFHSMMIASVSLTIPSTSSSSQLPSSCIGVPDGDYWLKPIDGDDYPVIQQQCNNEYMIIDLDLDPNVQSYFSSITSWHYALSGPELSDGANWEQWWLPSAQRLELNVDDESYDDDSEYFSFIISADCNSCDLSNNIESNPMALFNSDTFGDRTAYYMTGTMFGCQMPNKALKDCAWDYDTYQCNLCITGTSQKDLGYRVVGLDDEDLSYFESLYFESLYNESSNGNVMSVGLCGVLPLSTYDSTNIPQSRSECFDGTAYKPSIGNDGRHCVCVKPNESIGNEQYEVDDDVFTAMKNEHDQYLEERDDVIVDTGSIDDVYELWQSDFEDGTYRIQKSGTYKVMEDIVFDFNSGNLKNPNRDYSWWPQEEQQDEYPGAGGMRGNYHLGFIAGITVETDDVVIDLNDHEMKQSMALYFQQRFFSIISLKSVAFPLDQGPGVFGTEPKYANNVVIKNGKIGFSSHHGIHGHYNDDVVIENVHVYDFETHGIQMSYFKNLKMKNVEIGPSSKVAFLKGEYGYARWTLERLERILEGDYNQRIFPLEFSNREQGLPLEDITNKLRSLMDIAFQSVMGIEEYDDDDEEYLEAKELFINEDGIPYGAVMYGLFLNLWYSNVFRIHPSLKHAEGAEIENVYIHDLHHKTVEYVRMDDGTRQAYQNPWTAALDARAILGDQIEDGLDIDWHETEYVGTALTDAYVALAIATENWDLKGLLWFDSHRHFISWTLGTYKWPPVNREDTFHPQLGCNNDRMTHTPKGVQGIRMDGVEDVTFTDLKISNLHEYGALGSELCGDYWEGGVFTASGRGHALTNTPYFYGYTGNRAHGIFTDWARFTFSGNIEIEGVYSDTGLVRGIGLYTQSELYFDNDTVLNIHDLGAGLTLYDVDTKSLDHPYAAAEAKPFHVLYSWTTDDHTFYSNLYGTPSAVNVWCVAGRDSDSSDWDHSQFEDLEGIDTECSSEGGLNLKMENNILSRIRYRYEIGDVVWGLCAVSILMAAALYYKDYRKEYDHLR